LEGRSPALREGRGIMDMVVRRMALGAAALALGLAAFASPPVRAQGPGMTLQVETPCRNPT
jgi:hypothetical protein